MATIKRFEDIDIWKVARDRCSKIGAVIGGGPNKKSYRLIGQTEGACGSIIDNIAEGFERGIRSEFIQLLGYSKGSCGELRSQLYRSLDRNFISQQQFHEFYSMAVESVPCYRD